MNFVAGSLLEKKKGLNFDVFNEVISDYDTDGDFKLSHEEFQNIVLPAANEEIRKYALKRSKSAKYKQDN